MQDALGTPLASNQSVNVAEVDATPFNQVMPFALFDSMTGISFFLPPDLTNAVTTHTGTMAGILIYDDPVGAVMPAASGPLRFAIADSANEGLVFKPTKLSVSKVNVLDIVATP